MHNPDNLTCPNCHNPDLNNIVGIEYTHDSLHHYDGVSEWRCLVCKTRWGRWTGEILQDGESEPVYGKVVPKQT